jgi:hypothetical protein
MWHGKLLPFNLSQFVVQGLLPKKLLLGSMGPMGPHQEQAHHILLWCKASVPYLNQFHTGFILGVKMDLITWHQAGLQMLKNPLWPRLVPRFMGSTAGRSNHSALPLHYHYMVPVEFTFLCNQLVIPRRILVVRVQSSKMRMELVNLQDMQVIIMKK